jgi:hypothetical protein
VHKCDELHALAGGGLRYAARTFGVERLMIWLLAFVYWKCSGQALYAAICSAGVEASTPATSS